MAPDALDLLPRVLRHLDQPLADASVLPNYLVASSRIRTSKSR